MFGDAMGGLSRDRSAMAPDGIRSTQINRNGRTMDDATKRLVAAGAVGHLCLYRYNCGKSGYDWSETAAYAARTFPDASPAVIAELIAICYKACEDAKQYYAKIQVEPCGESGDLS